MIGTQYNASQQTPLTRPNAMKEMAVAKVVRPIFLVHMVFDSSELNIWSGVGDLSFDSVTYTGLGDLLSISEIKETSDISATYGSPI